MGEVTLDDETEPPGERYIDDIEKFVYGMFGDCGTMYAFGSPLEDRLRIPFLPLNDIGRSVGEPPGELAADEGAVLGRPCRASDGRRP